MNFDFPASTSGVLGLLVCVIILFVVVVCLGFLFVFPPFFRGARQGTESRASRMLSKHSTNTAASQTQAQRTRESFLIEFPHWPDTQLARCVLQKPAVPAHQNLDWPGQHINKCPVLLKHIGRAQHIVGPQPMFAERVKCSEQ